MLLPGRVLDPGLPTVTDRDGVDLEDALDIAGVGKYQLLHCALMVAILGASLLEIIGSAFVVPAAVCDLDISDSLRGAVTCLPNIGIILTATLWGRLSDTWGRRPVLLVSCAASGLLGAAAALMPGLLSYAGCKLAASLFLSAPSSLTFAYGGELVPRRRRDLAVLLLSALLMMSSTLTPVLAWLILPYDWRLSLGYISLRPWRLLTLAYAAPLLICAALLVPAHESPKFLLIRGRADQALEVLRRIYVWNTGLSAEKYPVTSLKQHFFTEESGCEPQRTAGPLQLLRPPYLQRMALIGFLMFGVFCLLNGLFLFSPDTINKVMSGSSQEEGTICVLMEQSSQNQTTNATCVDTISTDTFMIMAGTSFVYASIVLLASISPISKKSLLIITYFVVGAACLMAGLLRNKMVAVVAMSALQLTALGVGPLTAYAVDLFPTSLRGTAVSATLMFGRVGSVAGANVAGVSLAAACNATFYGFTALLLVCAGLSFALPRTQAPPSKLSHDSTISTSCS